MDKTMLVNSMDISYDAYAPNSNFKDQKDFDHINREKTQPHKLMDSGYKKPVLY